jgi:pimeloyl-ACP methyl ester carboxylesterase
MVEPFRIAIPDGDIDDLRARLARTRWPDQLDDVGWSYGTDRSYVQALTRYWADEFDWRAQEAALNAMPQFRATVDGLGIHFVHRHGVGPDPLPLVLTHGWPSTFYEWHKVIGPLSDPAAYGGDPADAFHVVVPSLPGYGFSDIPRRPGMAPRRIAALWVALMGQLGYEEFAAHGCDWGANVTAVLGLDHPEHLVGIHVGGWLSLQAPGPRPDTEEERTYAARFARWCEEEIGYGAIQGTKPQTLAYGLYDSPAGLAAWIVEKWRRWTDCDGDIERVFSRDELLTTVAIYWFTGTINSANRLYYESRRQPVALAEGERVRPPAGFLFERYVEQAEPSRSAPPRRRAEEVFDVRRWTIAERGAHFPALETPELFVDEVRAFFRELRSRRPPGAR